MSQALQSRVAPENTPGVAPERHSRAGLVYGLSAYTMWGFIPLYFRALSEVPPFIVLCHRVIWSALFLVAVVSFRAEWPVILPVFPMRPNRVVPSAGALLVAVNWLLFIYAVA